MTTTTSTEFGIQIHLAETATGGMTFGEETPARFRAAGDLLWIAADTVEGAMEEAYREANIGAPYQGPRGVWIASYRHRDEARSLSVGDAVVVNGEAGFVVDRTGFRPMTVAERDVLAGSR